jgi:hypothetical protein
MRFKCFLLAIGLGLAFGPAAALAPLRGQAGGNGERGAKGRPQAHLKDRWNQLAGDAAVWKRADVTDPFHLILFDLVAERVQSTNGEITREQFLTMSRPAEGPRKDDAARKAPAVAESPKAVERAASRPRPAPAEGGKKAQLVKGPYAVDLPPKLPPWFREYDGDGDGQISLYEWRAAGQPVARFLEMDFNGDGFLTPDEVLPPEEVAGAKKEEEKEPEADPGSLTCYQDQVGKVFAFKVTGSVNGAVWGSGVYTADSTLATAAVHAGALEVGKTGTVKVRVVEPPPSFSGSTANGVTTRPFGQFPGAYQIVK